MRRARKNIKKRNMAFSRSKATQLYKDGQQPTGNTFAELFASVLFMNSPEDLATLFSYMTGATVLDPNSSLMMAQADGSPRLVKMSYIMDMAASGNLGTINDETFDPGVLTKPVNYVVKASKTTARTFTNLKDENGQAIEVDKNINGTFYYIASGEYWDFVENVLPDNLLTEEAVGVKVPTITSVENLETKTENIANNDEPLFVIDDANGNIGLLLNALGLLKFRTDVLNLLRSQIADGDDPLNISDSNGNILARISNDGLFEVANIKSNSLVADKNIMSEGEKPLEIIDSNGNILAQITNDGVMTIRKIVVKEIESSSIPNIVIPPQRQMLKNIPTTDYYLIPSGGQSNSLGGGFQNIYSTGTPFDCKM
ncbi:MAG: hypothetical protein DI598_19135, partial [Pseudopedobacter saltans]